ncbi:MAG TPA: YqgE/AlgH family protein [Gemmataceae bacterium]|nr:YqgE/AlgH family protein [Gemmataceae bacterium]
MSYAGCFLIAKPILQDPNFKRTVVFLLAHNAEGAFGLVVNRPAETKELPWPVFLGGPCPSPGLIMLHGHADWAEAAEDDDATNKDPQLAPGIYSGDAACLDRVADVEEGETVRFRVFSGYAGWGGGQLEGELAVGAWSVATANGPLLFDTPAEELWDHLAPPRIPEPSVN